MPYYNGYKWLRNAIESVINQTYSDWQLIIIDDNPNDNSITTFKKYYAKNKKIKFLELKKNKRAAGARMEGIKATNGDILSFIDQDDIWDIQKLEIQVKYFYENPNIDIIHTDIDIIDFNGKLVSGKSGFENNIRSRIPYDKLDSNELGNLLFTNNNIRIGTTAIKRNSFNNVGGFDDNFFGGEDWEFWCRCAFEGLKFKHLPAKLAFRRIHSDNVSLFYHDVRSFGLIKAMDKILNLYTINESNKLNRIVKVYSRAIISSISLKQYEKSKKTLDKLIIEINGSKLKVFKRIHIFTLKIGVKFNYLPKTYLKLMGLVSGLNYFLRRFKRDKLC